MSRQNITSALSVVALIVSLAVAGYVSLAADERAASTQHESAAAATVSTAAIGAAVREYLLANPEVMLEVQDALERKQQEERVAAQQKALSEDKERIFASEHQVEIGEDDAPYTIVEFFDYNCGFCKRALGDMRKFVEEDPQVRFVLKEFPVLGEPSLEAHRVSIVFARNYPEKAGDFHIALLGADGRKDGQVALALAEKMGADREKIEAELEAPYVAEAVREVYALAESLGINGTPSYVVGDEVVFGAVGFSSLNEKVASLKECGKATC